MVDLLRSWKCSQTLTLFSLDVVGVFASSGLWFRLIRCEKVCGVQIRRFDSPQKKRRTHDLMLLTRPQ